MGRFVFRSPAIMQSRSLRLCYTELRNCTERLARMSEQSYLSLSFSAGQKIGGYEIRRLLERSGAGGLYRAYAPDLDQDVMLKALRLPGGVPESTFQRTVQSVARLEHPNIARIFDFGVSGGVYYVVTELIDGPSLRDYLSERRGGLPSAMAIRIFRQLADALAYAHTQGVIHQGIRPGSIWIDAGERVVLTDFGLARLAVQPHDPLAAIGPVDAIYLSPEQAAGREATVSSDIYALGIVLYEMVTGDVPFKGETVEALLAQHRDKPPRPPSQLVADLDPRIEQVVLRALAKNPHDRFASSRDMIGALEKKVAAGEYDTFTLSKENLSEFHQRVRTAQEKQSGPAESAQPAGSRRTLALAIAAVVIVVLVVLVILVLSSQGAIG